MDFGLGLGLGLVNYDPRFAIEENGMSCAPSWKTNDDFSYNMFLFTVGFFLPLSILIITGLTIVKTIKKVSHFV